MNKKAIEIMAGSTVLVEYGVPDNYVPLRCGQCMQRNLRLCSLQNQK